MPKHFPWDGLRPPAEADNADASPAFRGLDQRLPKFLTGQLLILFGNLDPRQRFLNL